MNKIVVISGASGGIGKVLQEEFLKNNDVVVSLSRSENESENSIRCDVRNKQEIINAFSTIKEKYGKIDVLINNAGVGISGAVELISDDEMQSVYETDLIGAVRLTKEALPLMGEGAKIIFISSVCAMFPYPYRTYYASAKAGLSAFAFGLRMELSHLKIQVTAICPGDIKTGFTKNRIKNTSSSSRYGKRIVSATEKSDKREDKRMDKEKVSKKIFKIIQKKKLKAQYIVGGKYKALNFFSRYMTKSALLDITNKTYGGEV